ncbi:Phage tail protein [compost metagenome]
MTDRRALLPHNSTPLERSAAVTCADIEDVPIPIRLLSRAETTPAHLLTWVAWERSVDRWDESWSIQAKRNVVRSSFFVHKHKGTIGALRRVVEPLGYLLEVKEWWQIAPEGRRGTFRLSIGVLETGITEAMYAELVRLIEDAKRQSQHIIELSIAAEVRGSLLMNVAAYDGDELTVYPYLPEPINVHTLIPYGVREHLIDTMTVYP